MTVPPVLVLSYDCPSWGTSPIQGTIRSCLVICLRRWACAVLLRGRLLDIKARERVVLSSLRAFNHPEFRGVSPRV